MSNKLSQSIRQALLMGTAAALSFTYQSAVFAADSTATDNDNKKEESLQEVVVTGSLIRLPKNITSTSPIQVVDSEEIKLSGKSDITDLINQLPQVFSNDLGQDLGNRTAGLSVAGGLATADLRGLGPNRTLVLVDGRRIGVGDSNTAIASPAPDLDQIPTALIDRIEVTTGGASAVYGSDAIAGVVNFIMKKDFQGLEFEYQVGGNWHQNHNTYMQNLARDAGFDPPTGTVRDGKSVNLSLTTGTNFADDTGNVTAYFTYLKMDPVTSGARDFGSCQLFVDDTNDYKSGYCSGSANSNLFESPTAFGQVDYSVKGNQFVDWGNTDQNPPTIFNAQKYIYIQRGDTRYTGGFLSHIDINDHFKPYMDFNFMNDRSQLESPPTALFFGANPLDSQGNGNYNVNCSNPLLSDQERALICTPQEVTADAADPGSVSANLGIGRRNVEGGTRQAYYEHTNYRIAVGARGDIDKVWNYDAYGQYYYTSFYNSNDRYFNFQAITNALQVTTDSNGNPVCISGPPCVPYNIFTEGGVTQDQLDYLYQSGTAYGTNSLQTFHADVSGDLGQYNFRIPSANDGVAVSVGFEHRLERLKFLPDSAELSGLLSGFGGASAAIDRSVTVDEEFAEVRVPIAQDKPFIRDLLFDTAFRRSDYSTSGVTNTHKFELQYAPTNDVRLRTSYSTAIRAPSLIELYNPQIVSQIQIGDDPCAPTKDKNNNLVPATATLAQCENTGVTAAQYGDGGATNTIPQGTASQLAQLQGGNPQLTPETAKTYSVGLTFSPTFLQSFTGSIDYFHIKLSDGIATQSASGILTGCLQTGDPALCSQIVRSKNGGLIGSTVAGGGYIVQTSINVAESVYSGIDLQGTYVWQLPKWGSLQFALNGAYMLQNASLGTGTSAGTSTDCAGLFGASCQTVNSRWRHNLMVTWRTPADVDVSLKWRYFSAVKLDNNDPDPALLGAEYSNSNGPIYDYLDARIPSFSYLDLSANWKINKVFTIRGGINNIFDKDPPMINSDLVSGGAANTYGIYDLLGRQWFLALNVKL